MKCHFASGFATLCLSLQDAHSRSPLISRFLPPPRRAHEFMMRTASCAHSLEQRLHTHAGTFVASWNGIDDMGVLRLTAPTNCACCRTTCKVHVGKAPSATIPPTPVGIPLHHGRGSVCRYGDQRYLHLYGWRLSGRSCPARPRRARPTRNSAHEKNPGHRDDVLRRHCNV